MLVLGHDLTICSDDTIKFRVYELIVRVAGSSDRGFEAAENDMLLDEIINEAKSEDILIKINAIEMFTEVRQLLCVIDYRETHHLHNNKTPDSCYPSWFQLSEKSKACGIFGWRHEK